MTDTNGHESVRDKDRQIKKKEEEGKKGKGGGSACQLQRSPHPKALLPL